jgi:hypothetical protein
MRKSLSREEKDRENDKWKSEQWKRFLRGELKDANEKLEGIIKRYPEIQHLVQTLLLIGGDTVELEGWATPENLEFFAHTGKSVSKDEVSTAMALNEECEIGMCFSNAAEFINRDLRPAFAFALAERYDVYSYWFEHFILKHVPTGTYHETTPGETIKWYFVVDITMKQFNEMGDSNPEWLSW